MPEYNSHSCTGYIENKAIYSKMKSFSCPRHEGKNREQRYGFTYSETPPYNKVSHQIHAPTALSPGKESGTH